MLYAADDIEAANNNSSDHNEDDNDNRKDGLNASIKAKLKPYLVKMASQTYIHGVKEVYESKTPQERLFWIVVCVACIGAAAYEIFQVVRLYKDDAAVATKISIENVDTMRYPTILFCPTFWLSRERLRAMKVEPEVMNFTLSLLEPGGSPARFQHVPNESASLRARLSDIVTHTNSGSIANLLKTLALTNKPICKCCNMSSVRNHVTLAGVCSIVELCETAFQLDRMPSIIYYADMRQAADTLAQVPGGFISIHDNESQIGISNHDTIFLSPNVPVRIKLSVTRMRRISTDVKPCGRSGQARSLARCEFDCIDVIKNRLCYNCSKYGLFSPNSTSLPQCPPKTEREEAKLMVTCEEDRDITQKLLECKKNCVPPCQERVYTVGIVTAMNTVHNEEMFSGDPNIQYLKADFSFTTFTETVIEDVSTFNVDKFISSIGGQTGLWCGASVVSLCQIISFCCCPCLHWTHLRTRYNNMC